MKRRTNIEITMTPEEFNDSVNRVAELQLDVAALELERDQEKERILAEYNGKISDLNTHIKAEMLKAQNYAEKNWGTLAPNATARSSSTELANFGFRTGQPTIKVLEKGKKQEDIAEQLQDADHAEYVTVKLALNKPAILKAYRNGVALIKSLFEVNQTERFFVEAKATKEN